LCYNTTMPKKSSKGSKKDMDSAKLDKKGALDEQFAKSQELLEQEKEMHEGVRLKHEAIQEHEKEKGVEIARMEEEEVVKGKERKEVFKKQEEESKEGIVAMKKKKETDEKKQQEIIAKQKEEKKKQVEYMEEMEASNARKDRIVKRKYDSEKYERDTISEAKLTEHRKKGEADKEALRKKKITTQEHKKERGDIDTKEAAELRQAKEDSRSKVAKLNAMDKSAQRQLSIDIGRKRNRANAISDPNMQRRELQKIDTEERQEKSKMQAELKKKISEQEVQAKKAEFDIKSRSHSTRDKLTTDERVKLSQIERDKQTARRRASDEAQEKKRGIGKMQEKIMKGETEEKNEYAWGEDYQ